MLLPTLLAKIVPMYVTEAVPLFTPLAMPEANAPVLFATVESSIETLAAPPLATVLIAPKPLLAHAGKVRMFRKDWLDQSPELVGH
jgi:hypothetical protein